MTANGITDVVGIAVGHHTDAANGTGCTAVLCEAGAVGGVDVRGSSPGTRETDLLRPTNKITHVHGVLLSGGSAFGLDAASGVVRYLEERGVGYKTSAGVVPIVPAAIIFDLGVVAASVRPGPVDGYAAALAASAGAVAEGSVGAGTGATVGKLLGAERAVKGGLGTWALDLGGGLAVGALMVVNAVGGVHDPDTGELVAGARNPGGGMSGWLELLDAPSSSAGAPPAGESTTIGVVATNAALTKEQANKLAAVAHNPGGGMSGWLELLDAPSSSAGAPPAGESTTIGVVATNAALTKEQANKLAAVAHDGIALAVRPAHTMSDGDTMFALATGAHEGHADFDRICAAAAMVVGRAIVRGVREANGLGGFPAVSEL